MLQKHLCLMTGCVSPWSLAAKVPSNRCMGMYGIKLSWWAEEDAIFLFFFLFFYFRTEEEAVLNSSGDFEAQAQRWGLWLTDLLLSPSCRAPPTDVLNTSASQQFCTVPRYWLYGTCCIKRSMGYRRRSTVRNIPGESVVAEGPSLFLENDRLKLLFNNMAYSHVRQSVSGLTSLSIIFSLCDWKFNYCLNRISFPPCRSWKLEFRHFWIVFFIEILEILWRPLGLHSSWQCSVLNCWQVILPLSSPWGSEAVCSRSEKISDQISSLCSRMTKTWS